MLLSVVSALARLNLDPWQEAANLAQLPGTTATRRLTSLIAALPDRPSTHLAPGANAARLIARLPRRVGSKSAPVEASCSAGTPARMQSQTTHYYMALILMVLLAGIGIAAGERSAAGVHNAEAAASSTVTPPTSPPTSGQ